MKLNPLKYTYGSAHYLGQISVIVAMYMFWSLLLPFTPRGFWTPAIEIFIMFAIGVVLVVSARELKTHLQSFGKDTIPALDIFKAKRANDVILGLAIVSSISAIYTALIGDFTGWIRLILFGTLVFTAYHLRTKLKEELRVPGSSKKDLYDILGAPSKVTAIRILKSFGRIVLAVLVIVVVILLIARIIIGPSVGVPEEFQDIETGYPVDTFDPELGF